MEEPRAHLARIESLGARVVTEVACGDMVWRAWGDGPPLVLLHGASGSWTHWIRNGLPLAAHRRVLAAQRAGHFDREIVPLYDASGKLYPADDGVREDSTPENLAKLKPFFDRKYGNVTAGNSSQITDGAAWMVLASEAAVARYRLPVLGTIVDSEWAGLDPAEMGLGPVHAATPLLQRHRLALGDVDAWEINEAFAAQVIACLEAWESDEYCRNALGLPGALGRIDPAKLNVDGGAIALGHPVGASGARIVLHLLNVLERTKGKRGMAAICIGGGQGGAMLVERANA